MSKKMERLSQKIQKRKEIYLAIGKGLDRGKKFRKQHDKVLCIVIDLELAGFKIVRDPNAKKEDA
jgi:hypothetical protein